MDSDPDWFRILQYAGSGFSNRTYPGSGFGKIPESGSGFSVQYGSETLVLIVYLRYVTYAIPVNVPVIHTTPRNLRDMNRYRYLLCRVSA